MKEARRIALLNFVLLQPFFVSLTTLRVCCHYRYRQLPPPNDPLGHENPIFTTYPSTCSPIKIIFDTPTLRL